MMIVQSFGVADAASENIQNRERKDDGDSMGEGNGEEQWGRNWKLEVSWHKQGSGTSPKRECWKTEKQLPREEETWSAPPPPQGTPLPIKPTWPGPPKDPPAEMDELVVEDVTSDLDFDANHARNPREHVIIIRMRLLY